MKKVTLIAWFISLIGAILCINNTSTNSSDANKDMGNQEALTFYHTNGSNVDLSAIPTPLLTNVTAQSMVQIAPKPVAASGERSQISWSALKNLASLPQTSPGIKSENEGFKIAKRSAFDEYMPEMFGELEYFEVPKTGVAKKRALNSSPMVKREVSYNKTMVKVVKGAAVIPQGVNVQSIAIPPLLSLNNNLSDIPVPIPNTSIVHYAKINTVVRKP